MKMTKELINALRTFHKDMKEDNLDDFTKKLRKTSNTFNWSYQEVLNLLLDEEKLSSTVVNETREIDMQIAILERQVEELKAKKADMVSLVCEFRGGEVSDNENGKSSKGDKK